MALQGNPFLGKLKIPAPDLSRIPKTPFESKASELPLPSASPSVETEPETDRVQTGSELGFNRVQELNEKSSSAKLNPIEPVLVRVQTGSETGSNSSPKLPAYGELAVLRYFADREPAPGGAISTRRREIATGTAQTLNGVKTALRRLREAHLIELRDFVRGPNRGITSYCLTPAARELLGSKLVIERLGFNRVQTGSETGSNGFSSSSSSVLDKDFKTTTTSEPKLFESAAIQLAPEWQAVDISPLVEIGFNRDHLIQIIRQGLLKPDEVEASIEYFAFDLKRNNKAKTFRSPPLNAIMGILRKGPYAPPENFESPADEARRKTREFKERKERERQAEEQKIMDLEFSEWRRGLSSDELAALLPEFARKPGPIQDSALKTHFETAVWPGFQAERLGVSESEHQQIRTAIAKSLEEVRE